MKNTTLKKITEYATDGGLNPSWVKWIKNPWTLVMRGSGAEDKIHNKDSVDIHTWYREQKPLRALAELQISNPEQYVSLIEIQEKAKNWEIIHNAKMRAWCKSDCKEEIDWDAFYKEHDELVQAAHHYALFCQSAINEHCVDDIYGDISKEIELGHYIQYLLFRNEEDGRYLSLMIDARHNLSLRDENKKPNFVRHKVFEGDRDLECLTDDVKWEWAAHLVHCNRFAPFYDPENVKSLDEAERLRAKFNGAAHVERPAVGKEVFDFYPAFMRAYGGEDGFFRALVDVYGPQGNVRHCSDMGVAHNHWDYSQYNDGEETGRQYEVDSFHFLKLFEQMGKKERVEFELAFNRFVEEVLPTVVDDIGDKGNKGFSIAQKIAKAMAYLKISIEYGTGAHNDAHWFEKFQDTEHEMLDIALRTPGRWARHNTTGSFETRAPKF